MKAKRPPKPIDTVFRAKADTGWTRESIHTYIKEEIEMADEDLPMFSITLLTDEDCQKFVDDEFAVDCEHEEDAVDERNMIAMKLYKKVTKRAGW